VKPDRFRSIDRKEQIISLISFFLTLVRDWPVRDFGFVNYDDPLYVTENLQVEARVTMEGFPLASAREERREKRLDCGRH